MFSSIRGFLSRHKRKFIIGGVIISSVVFLTRYTQRKLREWQENEIRILMEKTKKSQYFESTERSCNQMISSLTSTLRNSVIKENDTEAIINQLKDGSANKVTSWNQLKVLAITRTTVIIYSYTMLVTFLRIQLNLISGHMYKNAQSMDDTIGNEVQERYMAVSSYFIYEGVKNLSNFIKSKVEEVTALLPLTKQLSLRDLEQIYWAIISSVSTDSSRDPVKNCTYYIFQQEAENRESSTYSKLIDQMLDILESEEVQDLMQKNVRSGFALLIDHISAYFGDASETDNVHNTRNGILFSGESSENAKGKNFIEATTSNVSPKFVDVNKTTMALAKIIPILNGQVPDNPISRDVAADWLQCLMLNNELKMLAANVYEAVS